MHVLLHCSRPTVGSLTLLRLIQVEPGASLEYAWDEPQATRRLRCVLEDQAVTYRDAMHQYSLDEIRVSQQFTYGSLSSWYGRSWRGGCLPCISSSILTSCLVTCSSLLTCTSPATCRCTRPSS